MKQELLYATSNPGKLDEVGKFLESAVELHSPEDYNIVLEVAETGDTLEENALLKAEAYRREVGDGVIVMADDTGLEIDALGGEPGVKVRRWIDGVNEATDRQIIDYCLDRMKDVPAGERGAQFRTVIALSLPGGDTKLFDGILRGELAEAAQPDDYPGLPFRGLFYVPEAGVYLGKLEDDPNRSVLTHRQKAVQKAVDCLSQR